MVTVEITDKADGVYGYTVTEDGEVTAKGQVRDPHESCPACVLIGKVANDLTGRENAKAFDHFALASARVKRMEIQ